MQVVKLLSWESKAAVNKVFLSFLLSKETLYRFSEDAVIGDVYSHADICVNTMGRKVYAIRGDANIIRVTTIASAREESHQPSLVASTDDACYSQRGVGTIKFDSCLQIMSVNFSRKGKKYAALKAAYQFELV